MRLLCAAREAAASSGGQPTSYANIYGHLRAQVMTAIPSKLCNEFETLFPVPEGTGKAGCERLAALAGWLEGIIQSSAPPWPRWWDVAGWAKRPNPAMRDRLTAAIIEQRAFLDIARRSNSTAKTSGHDEEIKRIKAMLWRANEALARNQLVQGWQEIYDARLATIAIYTDKMLQAYRLSLREEARDVLSDGRLRSVVSLLAETGSTPHSGKTGTESTDDQSRANVLMARHILDGHYWGIFLRALAARIQIFVLPVVLVTILGVLLAVSVSADPPALGRAADSLVDDPIRLIWVYAFGTLGALLSMSISAVHGLPRNIDLALTGLRFNLTRLLVGAASAAAVVAILETSLFDLNADDTALILAVAIAAGFSERLLTNAVRAVVQGDAK
jgi:hypothetical protein